MSDIRALNGPFRVFAPAIQAGFTTRLKTEQAAIRKLVIRMDTMRRTSYVAAGYLIAEVTALALIVVLVVTDLGVDRRITASLVLVGLISYLLIYLVSLIRDLDNPFEYRDGTPGPPTSASRCSSATRTGCAPCWRALDDWRRRPGAGCAGRVHGRRGDRCGDLAAVGADDSADPAG